MLMNSAFVIVFVLCVQVIAEDDEFFGKYFSTNWKLYCLTDRYFDLQEMAEALGFFDDGSENSPMKRFLYSGQEQRREVRERYEEKCERSIFHKSRARWCPELDS